MAPVEQRVSTLDTLAGDRFELGDELGRGGMGRVVGARDRRLGREVAIKEAAEPSPALMARFEREIRITARLQHPSIVPLYDAGHTAAGAPYYVMRRVAGRSLHAHITEAPELRARLALLPSFLAAADAIAYAHAQGIIHRDIKPANILLGDHGETVVIDWGLAKLLGDLEPDEVAAGASPDGLTEYGAVLGTRGYMAPEQRHGEPADARGDVYALGATLHHILAGAPPREEEAPLPASVPRDLAAIVDKATAPDRDDRYADASGLAGDLRRYLTGQLVAAHRYSLRERIARFARRHAIAVAVAGVAAVVVVATLIIAVANIVAARDRAELGWERAIDRGDELLLARADSLVDTDPTRAALLAAALPLESPRWPRARTIVARARASGIARMIGGHRDVVGVLELDGTGRRLLASDGAGGVVIHDLVAGGSQELQVAPGSLHDAAWADGHRAVAVGLPDRIAVLEVPGVARREIRTTGPATLASPADAGYLAWRDQAGAYVSAGPATSPVQLAGVTGPGSIQVSLDGRWLATWATGEPLRLWRRDGTGVVLPEVLDAIAAVAFAADGSLAAAITYGGGKHQIVELALGEAVVVRRTWDVRLAGRLIYGGRDLYAATGDGQVLAMQATAEVRALTGSMPLLVAAVGGGSGVAISTGDDRVILVDRSGVRTLHVPDGDKIRRLVATADRTLLAGTFSGSIARWDLRDAEPIAIPGGPPASFLGFLDPDTLVACEVVTCARLRWRTGARLPLATPRMPARAMLTAPGAELALFSSFDDHVVAIRIRDGAVEPIAPGAVGLIALAGPRAAVAIRGREVSLVRPFTGPARPLATLDADPLGVAASEAVVAVALAGHRLWRIELGTGATASVAVPELSASGLAVTASGDVVATAGRQLVRWTAGRVEPIAVLPAAIVAFAADPTGGGTAITRDRTVHLISPAGATRSLAAPSSSGDLILAGRPGLAIMLSADRRTTLIDAEAGVVRVLGPAGAASFATAADGTVAVRTLDGIELYPDDLPRDPEGLRRWLDRATNAVLDGDPGIRWR